jgi:succinylglutamate desuccinylase
MMDARRTALTDGADGWPVPAIEVPFPELARWAEGNAGIGYAWTFESDKAGPHVLLQALTHGNEVCGAIALDWLLGTGFRPVRGTLSVCFANVAAYRTFDHADPFASRCVDEDFNRLWTAETLDGPRRSAELDRARELRVLYDRVDYLLDLHSMTDPCPPLAMAGRQRKGVELAQALGTPEHIVIDAGHAAGTRLRDYAFFDDATDPRNALLIECGQHWASTAPDVAKDATLRACSISAWSRRHSRCAPRSRAATPQQVIEVTATVTIDTDDFASPFRCPVSGRRRPARCLPATGQRRSATTTIAC